jgi:FtsH-binding integral membrane protein
MANSFNNSDIPQTVLVQDENGNNLELSIDTEVANRVIGISYRWMTIALMISALVSFSMVELDLILPMLDIPFIFGILIIAQIGLVMLLSSMLGTAKIGTLQGLMLLYAATVGISLSFYTLIFTSESIATVFFTTSLLFGGCTAYGYYTKKNIQGWIGWLMPALIGMVLATIVNFFLKSEMVTYVMSWIGILVFSGLAAYDTQKILVLSIQAQSEDDEQRIGLMGALELYLDFINLFIMLLRIFGKRK